ncbi:MAG: hypothetical protein AAB316_09595 [Bacteroidota bacterium]
MEDLLLKFNSLDGFGRQQLLEFLDFLLQKHHVGKVSKAFPENQPPATERFDYESFRRRILQITSVWTEDDVKLYEENHQHFNSQKIAEW